jgi:hypothetical protein
VTLVAVAPLIAPQLGEHASPSDVSAHMTPELVASFWTCAFSVTGADATRMVVILLVIVTEIAAGAVTVSASESDFVESFTDVAVMVGALFGAAGRLPGGV